MDKCLFLFCIPLMLLVNYSRKELHRKRDMSFEPATVFVKQMTN